MLAFKDCVGLWVGSTCKHCLNSIGLKEFLKLDSSEFGSLVIKTDEWSWVVIEPSDRARSDRRHKPRCSCLYPKQQSTQAS